MNVVNDNYKLFYQVLYIWNMGIIIWKGIFIANCFSRIRHYPKGQGQNWISQHGDDEFWVEDIFGHFGHFDQKSGL